MSYQEIIEKPEMAAIRTEGSKNIFTVRPSRQITLLRMFLANRLILEISFFAYLMSVSGNTRRNKPIRK